jgi:hypothetical protein
MNCPMCGMEAWVEKVEARASTTWEHWTCPVGHKWQAGIPVKDWWKDPVLREQDRREFQESMYRRLGMKPPAPKDRFMERHLPTLIAFMLGLVLMYLVLVIRL